MQRIFRQFLMSALVVALFGGVAGAQETLSPELPSTMSSAKKALIKEFLEVMGGRESMDQMVNIMFLSLEAELPKTMTVMLEKDPNLTAVQKKALKNDLEATAARMMQRYRELFTEKINIAQVIEDISYTLYDKHFTESELQDLIAFYKTPTGRKIVTVMPTLMMESIMQTSEILAPLIDDFIRQTAEVELAAFLQKKKPKTVRTVKRR